MALNVRANPSNFVKSIFILFAVLLIIFSLAGTVNAFAGGDGTAGNPYQIADESHLMMINGNLSRYFILGNDITLTSLWTPLGSAANPFTGSLDGNGSMIVGLQIISSTDNVGLFAVTDSASIFNLTIESIGVSGNNQVGVVAGNVTNTTFDNISVVVTGDITGSDNVGGLVGYMDDESEIFYSHATGTVTGNSNVGGLVGQLSSGQIISSSAAGNVEGFYHIGGLVGDLYNSTISMSYATGDVIGILFVGGLVGWVFGGTISDSSAAGNVEGEAGIGGLVGGLVSLMDLTGVLLSSGTIFNSFATGNVEGEVGIGGLVGATDSKVSISESFATGDVEGISNVGGLVGELVGSLILNSFSAGNVEGVDMVGGLVGHVFPAKDWGTGDYIPSTISNSYATGSVEGVDMVGGLVGRMLYVEISNSMALNNFVNGATNVHRDFGEIVVGPATLSVDVFDVFVWNNLTINGTLGTAPLSPETEEITSIDVWNTYPSALWTDLGFTTTDWVLNSYGKFLLPVHIWFVDAGPDAPVIADATHLIPRSVGGGGGGSGTGNATVVDPITPEPPRPPITPEPPEPPEPPVTPEPPEAAAIIILLFVIGIAAFTYRKVEEVKEK